MRRVRDLTSLPGRGGFRLPRALVSCGLREIPSRGLPIASLLEPQCIVQSHGIPRDRSTYFHHK